MSPDNTEGKTSAAPRALAEQSFAGVPTENAVSDKESLLPPVVIEMKPDEIVALQLLIQAESLSFFKSKFFTCLPYLVVVGLAFGPAYPQPTQIALGLYSLATYLGYKFEVARKNPWFEYQYFLAPLILATVAKAAPLFGRIILCQLAFHDNLDKIEQKSHKASTFVTNTCVGYKNQELDKIEWGFLGFDVLNLCLLLLFRFLSQIHMNKSVWGPVKRLGDRIDKQAKGGETWPV